MDAFFAAVEQRDQPRLRGLPVAVAGSSDRAVVVAASYEARRYGVRSALPLRLALRRCPELVVVPPRFDVYREVSLEVRAIFHRFTPLVEPLALDEAYLDVTEPLSGPPSGTLIARAIKTTIFRETRLTASAGVATGKFLAKVASGLQKPDGLSVILPEQTDAFLAALPIEKFFGVGPATLVKMHGAGIRTGADMRARSAEELERLFGKSGLFFHAMALGQDDRPVLPNRERKSIGAETTFEHDRQGVDELDVTLVELSEQVYQRLTRAGSLARCVTVKLRFADFRTITRSHTLEQPLHDLDELVATARVLAFETPRPDEPVRLIGVTLAQLAAPGTVVFQPRLEFPA